MTDPSRRTFTVTKEDIARIVRKIDSIEARTKRAAFNRDMAEAEADEAVLVKLRMVLTDSASTNMDRLYAANLLRRANGPK